MLQDQVASNKKSSSRYCCYKKEITGVNYGKVTVFVRIRRRYYCYKKKGIRAAKTRGRYFCYKTKGIGEWNSVTGKGEGSHVTTRTYVI